MKSAFEGLNSNSAPPLKRRRPTLAHPTAQKGANRPVSAFTSISPCPPDRTSDRPFIRRPVSVVTAYVPDCLNMRAGSGLMPVDIQGAVTSSASGPNGGHAHQQTPEERRRRHTLCTVSSARSPTSNSERVSLGVDLTMVETTGNVVLALRRGPKAAGTYSGGVALATSAFEMCRTDDIARVLAARVIDLECNKSLPAALASAFPANSPDATWVYPLTASSLLTVPCARDATIHAAWSFTPAFFERLKGKEKLRRLVLLSGELLRVLRGSQGPDLPVVDAQMIHRERENFTRLASEFLRWLENVVLEHVLAKIMFLLRKTKERM